MGRNAVPKIGVFDGPTMYRFRYTGKDNEAVMDLSNGNQIVLERITQKSDSRNVGATHEEAETLAVAFADGTQEVLLAMFMAGWFKGVKAGEAKAKLSMRQTLEITEPDDSKINQMREALKKMQSDLDALTGK